MTKSRTPAITLTTKQRKELERLWFIYGNHGPKMNYEDHGFIQHILERGRDPRGKRKPYYRPTQECQAAVDAILLRKR